MVRGLYTAATGMLVQQKRMDVITNNIANADTMGFKRDGVTSTAFDNELTRRLNDNTQIEGPTIANRIGNMNLGAYVKGVYTDFSQSGLKQTNSDLDIALDKDGFFAIEVMNKDGETTEKYTRDGSFTLGADGSLMTMEGNYVLGVEGKIQLPTGNVIIDDIGSIYVDGEYIDQLKIVSFEDNKTLKKFGNNLTDATEETKTKAYIGKVCQGFLEGSNVDSIQEMVNMITVMRNYETNQKIVQIHDQTLSKAVNEIGK